jgi:cytochrome c peroxidase
MRTIKSLLAIAVIMAIVWACKKDEPTEMRPMLIGTPYALTIPAGFPNLPRHIVDRLTEEGVALGRKLFFETKLSLDSTIACASCHSPAKAFSDTVALSLGINGGVGTRNAMPLFNLAYGTFFFWDGRATSLAAQAVEPVPNPLEMHLEWPEAVSRLSADNEYVGLFESAFGSNAITKENAGEAMGQFMTILLSGNSKFDKWQRGEGALTASEMRGFDLFRKEGGDPELVPGGQNGGDCFHCHSVGNKLFSDFRFHNNGLDSVFTDLGAYDVTGNNRDKGRFKTPSLRNVAYTAPYMHDGRFNTLEEVMDHYDTGGKPSETIDPFMKFSSGGLNLSAQDKQDLIAFMLALSDEEFIAEEAFQNPN